MSFGITAAGIGTAVSYGVAGASAAKGIAGLFGKKGKGGGIDLSQIKMAPFYTDEYYNPTQDELMGLGMNILDGDIPEYYAPIGAIGGPEFENVLGRTVADTTRMAEESAIKRGVGRGGPTGSSVAKAVGDVSSSMRWADYTKAVEGRGKLLNFGTDVLNGVRQAGLNYQSQKNNYQLNEANFELKKLGIGVDAMNSIPAPTSYAPLDIFGSAMELASDTYSASKGKSSEPEYDDEGNPVTGTGKKLGSAETNPFDQAMSIAKLLSMFAA